MRYQPCRKPWTHMCSGRLSNVPKRTRTTAPEAEPRLLPKIITFDESTGSALTAQDEKSETKAEASTPQLRLPWRAWHAHASGLGRQEAAMRCALQVLYMLHVNQVYDDMPIDILFGETKLRSMLRPQASSRPKASCCPRVCQRANIFWQKACTRIGWPLQ